MSSTLTMTSNKEDERTVFEKAKEHMQPGCFFRFVTNIYTERKLFLFLWIHIVCTAVIWVHYGLVKYESETDSIQEDTSRYWLKRFVPPFIFGSKHAILYQMALIPLTMCRFSIAALSQTSVNRIVPLSRAQCVHIFMGNILVGVVFIATVSFLIFYGTLCIDGEQEYCRKLNSEIMWTGYSIALLVLSIGVTSRYRYQIPYEIFYAVHHLSFVLYAITIAHTFDIKGRNSNKQRSQTFQWVSATFLFYICDRAAMHINHKYQARIVSSSTVGSNGSKMIILKLKRPVLFNFRPGQSAFLRLTEIDQHWHPYSIASGPESSQLEFYIEVHDEKSWTGKLWTLLHQVGLEGGAGMLIDVQGPYGTGLANTKDFSHAVAFGSGTGIVPVLSLFKQHVRQLLLLDPANHFMELERNQQIVREVEKANELRKGSVFKSAVVSSRCARRSRDEGPTRRASKRDSLVAVIRDRMAIHDALQEDRNLARNNLNVIKRAASHATRSIYGVVLLTIMPVLGIALIALTISWNVIDIELSHSMVASLKALTIVFQIFFALVALFVWDASQFFAIIDLAICCLIPFADWYWFRQYEANSVLNSDEIITYCLLISYLTVRIWSMTVMPRHRSWRTSTNGNISSLERLEIVWSSRSASLVSKILPEIATIWDKLVAQWGEENAEAVCHISIYVTDKDQHAVALLKQQLLTHSLYDCVHFARPDLAEILENHTLNMITTRRNSYTLLAFCGSATLAKHLHHLKINNDMVTAVTGSKKHQMDYVSDSYGGVKKIVTKSVDKKPDADLPIPDCDDPQQESHPDEIELNRPGFAAG
jgi:predicted ferric reductase